MGLDVDSSSCSAGFAILISSIIDICNGEIYELWPFSFLLLVMQLSEDKKKKKQRFTMYQCLAFCYKALFV